MILGKYNVLVENLKALKKVKESELSIWIKAKDAAVATYNLTAAPESPVMYAKTLRTQVQTVFYSARVGLEVMRSIPRAVEYVSILGSVNLLSGYVLDASVPSYIPLAGRNRGFKSSVIFLTIGPFLFLG